MAKLTYFHFNGGHCEVNLVMMRSRQAHALTHQETNSCVERIYGVEGFIFPPRRQSMAHTYTYKPNNWLFEVYSWGWLDVMVYSFAVAR